MSRTISIAQLVEKVKTSSSKMLKSDIPEFAWQSGYGAFSISAGDTQRVIAYVKDQKAHHRKLTFQEEYRQLLAEYGIAFDEQFVWD